MYNGTSVQNRRLIVIWAVYKNMCVRKKRVPHNNKYTRLHLQLQGRQRKKIIV